MSNYGYERDARTPYSEAYSIEVDGEPIGRIDLHLTTSSIVQATLCVPAEFEEDDIEDLIADIDARLVLSHHPGREDFVVTVWRGNAAGVYSEEADGDE
jgi:hypothetical protein